MPCTCPSGKHASDPPGSRYWVSVRDAGRHALVAGPYETHGEAEADVDLVRRLGEERDPRAVFYAWGTARTDADVEVPAPQLNSALNEVRRPPLTKSEEARRCGYETLADGTLVPA